MKIDHLKQLSEILCDYSPQNYFEVYGKSKLGAFYSTLLTSANIEEDLLLLYPGNKKANIRSLKSRYTKKLIQELFKIDENNAVSSPYFSSKMEVIKGLSLYQIIKTSGQYELGIELLDRYLKICRSNDFIYLKVNILSELTKRTGLFSNHQKRYETYLREFKEATIISRHRMEIDIYYTELGNHIITHKSYDFNSRIKAIQIELLNRTNIKEIYNSYSTASYLFECLYYTYLIQRNIPDQIETCKKALSVLSDGKKTNDYSLFSFNQKLGVSYLGIKKHDLGLQYFKKSIDYLKSKKSLSWHGTMLYIFVSFLLKGDYKSALKILDEVLKLNHIKSLPFAFREPWYIKEAFIHFLIRTGRIDPDKHPEVKLRSFRISRFVNEVTVYSKDKKGINITINIIQILFLIADKKYDAVADKLSSLKQYSYRYLRKPEYIRPSNFIKMLQTVSTCHFKKSRVIQKAARHLDVLKQNPMDYTEQALSIEIIPYERLWEEVLNLLE